jgi:hypothetical protein
MSHWGLAPGQVFIEVSEAWSVKCLCRTSPQRVIVMKVEKELVHVSGITLYMIMKNLLVRKCQSIMKSR